MPVYDLYCEKCGKELFNKILKVEEELYCEECGEKMKRYCNCRTFRLKYNNKTDICSWGDQGYNTSQYWRKVKEKREQGEKVKGFHEN